MSHSMFIHSKVTHLLPLKAISLTWRNIQELVIEGSKVKAPCNIQISCWFFIFVFLLFFLFFFSGGGERHKQTGQPMRQNFLRNSSIKGEVKSLWGVLWRLVIAKYFSEQKCQISCRADCQVSSHRWPTRNPDELQICEHHLAEVRKDLEKYQ